MARGLATIVIAACIARANVVLAVCAGVGGARIETFFGETPKKARQRRAVP